VGSESMEQTKTSRGDEMKTIILIIMLTAVTIAGAYSMRYCDICSNQIKTDEHIYLQSPSHNYGDICDECYRYLDIRIEEVIEDIRRADAMIHTEAK
jgi:hypothetical protein